MARSQGLVKSFCGSSSSIFCLAWLHSSCTGWHVRLSPISCWHPFVEFPWPAWAVDSCSSGPQAREFPKLMSTEYRAQPDVTPCRNYSMAHWPGELKQQLLTKPWDWAIDALCINLTLHRPWGLREIRVPWASWPVSCALPSTPSASRCGRSRPSLSKVWIW